jgi:hypothetical protein
VRLRGRKHQEVLHHENQITSRRLRWTRNVEVWGEEIYTQDFDGETCRKEPLGRSRHRWEDNTKIDLKEIGCGAWIGIMWLRKGHW